MRSLLEYADTYNPDVMRYALPMFAETSLDFVDCELIAYNHVRNAEIATFDKALMNATATYPIKQRKKTKKSLNFLQLIYCFYSYWRKS